MFVFIQHILYALQRLVVAIFYITPVVAKRRQFEKLNQTDALSASWGQGSVVPFVFHCSSEGEFEQLRPLMTQSLEQGDKLELIYTSTSVERRAQAFAQEFKNQVRVLRLPLVGSLRIKDWSRGKTLVMCRYDFFPELLLLPVSKRILVWGSLKGKSLNWWRRQLFQQFDLIIAATNEQRECFLKLGISTERVVTYDFRPSQIFTRLTLAHTEQQLAQALELCSRQYRLVLGSVWPHDFFLFETILKSTMPIHLWLAPHSLKAADLDQLSLAWQQQYPSILLLRVARNLEPQGWLELIERAKNHQGHVAWVLEQPGRLLELYKEFSYAYVGGGFGRSIHSVLEPLVAGCVTWCGPRIHRSTEVDLGQELMPGLLSVVHNAQEFSQVWENRMEQMRAKDDNQAHQLDNWIAQSKNVAGRILAQ